MAKKHRSVRSMTIPLAVVAGVAGGLTGTFNVLLAGGKNAPQNALRQLSRDFTGYDPITRDFDPMRLMGGLAPILVGSLVHIFASRFGVNRALGRARIPVVRV